MRHENIRGGGERKDKKGKVEGKVRAQELSLKLRQIQTYELIR